MPGFIEGIDREQVTFFPDRLEDWISEDHLVRVVDIFVEELDLPSLGFERCVPARTGRPGYHPSVLLKLCKRCLHLTGIQLAGLKFQGSNSSMRLVGWPAAIASRVALR
mgnify:CR=1 FL=1